MAEHLLSKAEYGYVYAKSYAACREKRRRMEDALPQKPMLTGEMSVCQAAEFFLSERCGALKSINDWALRVYDTALYRP